MIRPRPLYIYAALSAALLLGLIGLPQLIESRYLLHIVIMTGMYTALALSYDLVVGHVGLVSLAHPSFFGVGAYLAAILSTRFGTPFLANFVVAGLVAAGVAYLISIPFLRLEAGSFAIGTLGLALIVKLVAINEVKITGGWDCIIGVARPRLTLGPLLDWQVSSLTDYYYLMLIILLLVVALSWRLTTSRLGRTLISIREDETLAQASGVSPRQYKTLAFTVGALVAGGVGAFYVQYASLICPSEVSEYMTTALLIILFLGGVGRMRGVILGGIIFTFVPEVLRIAPTWRMVIYGLLLLAAIVFAPDGLDGIVTKLLRRLPFASRGSTSHESQEG